MEKTRDDKMSDASAFDVVNRAIENALRAAQFHAASVKGTTFAVRLFLEEAGYKIVPISPPDRTAEGKGE